MSRLIVSVAFFLSAIAQAQPTSKTPAAAAASTSSPSSHFDLAQTFPPDGTREFTVSNTGGSLALGSEFKSLNLHLGYMRYQDGPWVLGFEAGFGSSSYDDASFTSVSVLGVAHYLLEPIDFKSSYFALGAVGIANATGRVASASDDDTELSFRVGAGRRMRLMRDLYLRPELYIEKIGELDPILVFEFLKLSFLF